MKKPYLQKGAKAAIKRARNVGADLLMGVDSFTTDEQALMLRDLLWHAKEEGVKVTFIPDYHAVKEDLFLCTCCLEHVDEPNQYLHDFEEVCEKCFEHKEKCYKPNEDEGF